MEKIYAIIHRKLVEFTPVLSAPPDYFHFRKCVYICHRFIVRSFFSFTFNISHFSQIIVHLINVFPYYAPCDEYTSISLLCLYTPITTFCFTGFFPTPKSERTRLFSLHVMIKESLPGLPLRPCFGFAFCGT